MDAQHKWRTAVVRLSERVQVDWIEAKPLLDVEWGELAVSRPGTIAAAKVTLADGETGEPLVVVSMYDCGRALMSPPATVGLSPPTQSTVPFPTCRPSSEASKGIAYSPPETSTSSTGTEFMATPIGPAVMRRCLPEWMPLG